MASSRKQIVSIEGRRLQLSNLDKVLYPATGTTKGDVLAYFSDIAEVMLPHCRDRAVTRKRWPNGVGEDGSGQMFFQKDIGDGAPDWVDVRGIQHSDHVNHYPLVNDLATLTWLGQLAALEIHVPQWRFGDGDEKLNPDRLVLDLDPGPGVTLRECADVARLARSILNDMGLTAVPVTSGSKGIHMYAALDGKQSSEQVSKVAHELARSLEADHPDEIISSMKKSAREGRVFIDWSQNNANKTTIAPYSLRGKAHPMVAAPRTWGELASPQLKHLDYHEVLKRVKRRGDPMAQIDGDGSDDDAEPSRDRLTLYRSKRDSSKTPEPVPEQLGPDDTAADVFVIQRHDARRLHFDFRLEHDGVLVSWALPKGVPTDPKKNHLAVPTEDHPMEYRFFEGTIPKGEYGGGVVEIWDSGTVDIEKWRDDEVIATLTGQPKGGLGGTRKYALFRTKDDPQKPQWMIHLMSTEPETQAREHSKASGKPRVTDAAARRPARRAASAPGKPMLATRGTSGGLHILDEDEWAFEMKWDGMRAIVTIEGDDVRVQSRSGKDVTAAYPEFADIAAAIGADDAVLDGEIVAVDASGVPSFARLQQRMNLTNRREIAKVRQSVPVSLMLFDVLALNGQSCVELPYRQRRELLDVLVDEDVDAPISVPPAFDGDADAALAASRELGLEGVMAKRLGSTYRPGVRSDDWLKFPHADTAEVAVIGWRPSTADPSGIASLLLAIPGEDGLEYAGRVGTGFSSADRRGILDRLSRSERKTPPVSDVPAVDQRDARWVTPRSVGEVSFRERTSEGRLRHPVWRGWRPDKSIADINSPGA